MLEPREADIPALFLVLVVLPLVAYILLGKWSEGAKKRERVSLLAHLAAEEAFWAEPMATATVIPPMSFATVIPPMSSSNNGHRECARCFSPATTRCSRCKSVRYCSGKCQITHWRQVHKKECLQLDYSSSTSSPRSVLVEESFRDGALLDGNASPLFSGYNSMPIVMEKPPLDNLTYPFTSGGTATCSEIDTPKFSTLDRRTKEKRLARKSNREMSRREDGTVLDSSEDISGTGINGLISSNVFPTKEAYTTHKLRNDSSHVSEEETSRRHNISNSGEHGNGYTTSRSTMNESYKYQTSHGNSIEPNSNRESLLNEKDAHEAGMKCIPDKGNLLKVPIILNDEAVELRRSSEAAAMKGSVNGKISMHLPGNKISRPPKSSITGSGEYVCTEAEGKGHIVDETKIARARQSAHAEGSKGAANTGIMKIMSLRKPAKPSRHDAPEVHCDRHKKMKMLYPYEEFLKMFQFEIVNLMPKGLMNIGNSCYANAVMQCLTCTKPLINYLLHRSHSRSCCARGWCLMCELEQHVMMLREGGGPLSLSRILSRMRSANCQIGNGSQEDAHEFLRLLVSSMQSICLEGLGGESKVDPRLQETTFIQHTFGGRLRSKVKCLGCHHESERYENIMDLTLEIYGWVESLEDALTQFTTPEDLDGENMYRCGRCAAYVRARKQLSIHEAPNVLTIVLKRFQEGRYGKINKWITFPDLLDMIPFMTGTNDMPPLYLLYAVVVHLDTLNASFSGHYVSYVKDLQGNWFRIDDTEVQQVPMSQVMSEGAYILFYMRSCPRPQRASASKANREQAPASARHCTFKVSRTGQVKRGSDHVGPEPLRDKRPELTMGLANHLSNDILRRSTNRSNPVSMEFSDATSSDWSLFTSSDEASFTTESTRDSFSTVDYADACNDPISSIFNTMYAAPNSVSCRMSSKSRPQTRFVTEEKGYVSSSYAANQPLDDRVHKGDRSKQVSDFSTELHSNVSNCNSFVRYGGNPKNFSADRTSSHCKC